MILFFMLACLGTQVCMNDCCKGLNVCFYAHAAACVAFKKDTNADNQMIQ